MNKAVTFGLLCVVIISLVPSDAQKCSIKKKQLTKKVCQLNGIVSGLKGALEEHVKKAEETDTTPRLNKIETLVNDLTETVNALEGKDASCPNGFTTHGSSCYLFSKEKTSWTGALTMCNLMGTHLAEVTSKEENDFLFSKIIGRTSHFFIGAYDVAQEKQFVWAQSRTKLGFTNWAGREPSDQHGKENCVHMYNTLGQWNDVSCDASYFFICEKSNVIVG